MGGNTRLQRLSHFSTEFVYHRTVKTAEQRVFSLEQRGLNAVLSLLCEAGVRTAAVGLGLLGPGSLTGPLRPASVHVAVGDGGKQNVSHEPL